MDGLYNREWMKVQVAVTAAAWEECASGRAPEGRRYSVPEQQERERAYDAGLEAVEREARRARASRAARAKSKERVVAAFARFSAAALDLDEGAIELLTHDFLPVGTQLAQWARRFDPDLSMAEIIQACRNAWTACGLQPLLGQPVELTRSILGYSLLYPYSDNFLDREDLGREAKIGFSRRFRDRLRGDAIAAMNEQECAVWALVELIEAQYARARYPQVFECLLAIHEAQERSVSQLQGDFSAEELLRLSCAKGGSSVLADACLAHPWMNAVESRFAFEWGVLLQLGDDLQDLRDDLRRGSLTLFSKAAGAGVVLDELVPQLLRFSERTAAAMDGLAHGTAVLKNLLRMSWRSLILMAVAESHAFFSAEFLAEAEQWSPFRFGFLRERKERLAGRRGLYATLFDLFLEGAEFSVAASSAGVSKPIAHPAALPF